MEGSAGLAVFLSSYFVSMKALLLFPTEIEAAPPEIPRHLDMPFAVDFLQTGAVKTPRKWKKYEARARVAIMKFIADERDDFRLMLREFAGKIYNSGDGLVFLGFNERTQRAFLRKEYVAWMEALSAEIGDSIYRFSHG